MEVNKNAISEWLMQLQDSICTSLEEADGSAKFREDIWERKEGGGGRTRIIGDGTVIDKGGVLYSAVYGEAPDFLFHENEHSAAAAGKTKPQFYATGVSIVIHPKNPFVPIIHMNVRYFEMSTGTKWLGGGIDLTPHYINEKDAAYFHQKLKLVCDEHETTYYPKFKKWADDYFFIKHRNETRGVGGIFFDRLSGDSEMAFEKNLSFWKDVGCVFAPLYSELIRRNKDKSYTQENLKWQALRRGRYVEFNLVYDKGTKFGLESNGRIESILMSLPKSAAWEYDHQLKEGSEEMKTQEFLRKGVDWISAQHHP